MIGGVTDAPRPPEDDPYEDLDPEIRRILEGLDGHEGPDAQSPPAGPTAYPTTHPTTVLPAGAGPGWPTDEAAQADAGDPGRPGTFAAEMAGDPAGARRTALGAGLAWAATVVALALVDPSGLGAPIAWGGADLIVQPWSWLQYLLYGPLMVALVWRWSRQLLRSASPAAPRRWVLGRTWLLVVLAVLAAKLVYSVVLMLPALIGGAGDGLPWQTSWTYLVWATGFAGFKALLLGWLPGVVAALLWRPGPARRAGTEPRVPEPAMASLPAAAVVLAVALLGGWLADRWWTGSPVGYAHPTDWRLLAPTVASGPAGQAVALGLLWLLLAGSISATLRRIPAPRTGSAHRLAGAIAAVVAGLGLAVVESLVALVMGTDVAGGEDLWIAPSTYLRLIEGLSFGLLIAPVAALAVWLVPRAPRPQWSRAALGGAVAVVAGAVVLVTVGPRDYAGVPPLARQADPVAMPAQPTVEPGQPAAPGRITVRRDADGSAVLADQSGAQVVLRGVNVNALGDYYAADPAIATVAPLTEADFSDMAAMGFDVVRLILSWSKVQPQPDTVDEAYLAQIRQAVAWAGAYGIHVVLDMHQDAWGKSVVAPAGTTCRTGTSPMTGWDGAPEWASLDDGAPPCQFTGRDLAPNVLRSFSSFYANRSDIETQLVASWGRIAQEFGGNPTVVGYDLLNEPSFAEQAPLTSGMLLGRYHARAIAAIREGEAKATGGYPHPIFLEPSIWWSGFGLDPLPPRGFTTDSQIVFAPHLYNESITTDQSLGVTLVGVERGWALAQRAAQTWGVPMWVGEWGSWRDAETNKAYYQRFMAQADATLTGTAIWQWKQACGDPHTWPDKESGNIRRMACPEGTPLPTDTVELAPVTRAYARSAPGRLLSVQTSGEALTITGTRSGAGPVSGTPSDCTLDVWVPGTDQPVLSPTNVTDLTTVKVPAGDQAQAPSGGWRVIGCATGDYKLRVS